MWTAETGRVRKSEGQSRQVSIVVLLPLYAEFTSANPLTWRYWRQGLALPWHDTSGSHHINLTNHTLATN